MLLQLNRLKGIGLSRVERDKIRHFHIYQLFNDIFGFNLKEEDCRWYSHTYWL